MSSPLGVWRIAGSYLEACNCDAICPCRNEGDRAGGRSTTGECRFVLSWMIQEGSAGDIDLRDRKVVMAGWYSDDEPRSPWRVILYVDDIASRAQRDALVDIFLGRAGGTTLRNFAAAIVIGEVHAVKTVHIALDHRAKGRTIAAGTHIMVRAAEEVAADGVLTCAIPGHDRPGQELVMDIMQIDDDFQWVHRGKCGFTTDFAYSSED